MSTSRIHGSIVKTVNLWHSAVNVVIFLKIIVKINFLNLFILLIYLFLKVYIVFYFSTRGGMGWGGF